jgi:hypothetical protein
MRIRIRDPVLFYPKDPGSEIRNKFFWIPYLGSRIPNMTKIKFQVVKFMNYIVYFT